MGRVGRKTFCWPRLKRVRRLRETILAAYPSRTTRDALLDRVMIRVRAAAMGHAASEWQGSFDYADGRSQTGYSHGKVDGVGKAAFYELTADEDGHSSNYIMHIYDGNLVLNVTVQIIRKDIVITKDDLQARATKFANATMALLKK